MVNLSSYMRYYDPKANYNDNISCLISQLVENQVLVTIIIKPISLYHLISFPKFATILMTSSTSDSIVLTFEVKKPSYSAPSGTS